MIVTIYSSDAPKINWEATGAAEIIQNVHTLTNTFRYEVAYDRTLGIRRDYVDMPPQEAASLVTAQLYSIIDEREPRATLKDATIVGISNDGDLQIKVVIEI